LISKTTNKH